MAPGALNGSGRSSSGRARAARLVAPVLLSVLGLAALALYVVPPQRYRLGFQLQNFDYGILYHATGRIAAGRDGFMTVRGVEILADNQEYLLWLLAPLHWLPGTAVLLLLLHSLALWSCGAIAAALAWRRDRLVALALAAFAWWSPFLANMSLDLVHSEAFAAPLLLLVYAGWASGRPLAAGGALCLALACKEDVALSAGALMTVMALRPPTPRAPPPSAAWIGALACALVLTLNLGIVLPAAKQATCARIDPERAAGPLAESPLPVSPYFRDVAGDLIRPDRLLARTTRPEALAYLGRLLWPGLLVLPLAPAWALLPLPAAFVNVLSGSSYLVEGWWHYDHSSFALVLVGLVHATRRARRPRLLAGALLAGLVAAVSFGQPPSRTPPTAVLEPGFWHLEKDDRVRVAEALSRALPAEAVTSADYTTLNYLLDDRYQLYMFPNPLESALFGIAGLCTEWTDPPRPEVVVVRGDYDLSPELEARLDAGWWRWTVVAPAEDGAAASRRLEGRPHFRVWIDPLSRRAGALRAAIHNIDLTVAGSYREERRR